MTHRICSCLATSPPSTPTCHIVHLLPQAIRPSFSTPSFSLLDGYKDIRKHLPPPERCCLRFSTFTTPYVTSTSAVIPHYPQSTIEAGTTPCPWEIPTAGDSATTWGPRPPLFTLFLLPTFPTRLSSTYNVGVDLPVGRSYFRVQP